jgi:Leucine-rich repeat (LRR) protein
LDGTTFSVAVPEGTRVAQMKRAIGALREVPHYAMELFVEGKEEPLDDEKQLMSAEKVPLFMLPKQVSDRLALEALYKSCGGAGWERKDGWMTDAGLGEWQGVTVDAEGRVTKLSLGGNNLAGPLPSELQQLSALKKLWLHGNKLTGPVPAGLGQLGALAHLHLHFNQLSGPIPAELGQLGALTQLYLNQNQLSGPIPAELRQLGALEYLYLQGNPQLSGQAALRLHLQEHNPGCTFVG